MTSKSEKKNLFGGDATIHHEIKKSAARADLNLLTQHTVIGSLDDKKFSSSPVYRAKVLQNQYRFQMWRWITQHPERKYEGTYAMNCPPSGFLVRPKTKYCYEAEVCPWCFVRRRVVPVFKAIQAVPREVRQGNQVVSLRFEHAPTEELPFFRRDRGPHAWSGSLATVQTLTSSIVPEPDPPPRKKDDPPHPPSQLQDIYHVVLVLPEEENPHTLINQILERRKHFRAPTVYAKPFASLADAISVISGSYHLPWLQLFHDRNLIHFTNFKAKNSKRRLLRVNAYKSKEENSGD